MPVGVASEAPGDAAIKLAASAGLYLDEWQQNVLRSSLGVRVDGKWAAFSVGLIVPRQNGKGAVLEARALAGLFLFDEQLIAWTAHQMKTAKEGFRRIVALVKNTPDLMRQVADIKRGNDDRGIELYSGARLQFLTRSDDSGRGFSGDCVILDEAYKLDGDDMAALLPTLSAVPNPQIWYTSSAPMAGSEQLHSVRKRGIAGNDPRLAFFEWSVPDGADVSDRSVWPDANPGYPFRIDDEAMEAEWSEFGSDDDPSKFARERCGVPDEPVADVKTITAELWASLVDADSQIVSHRCYALDVSWDRAFASFAAAGRRADGRLHVEAPEHRPKTGWVQAYAVDLWRKHRLPIRIDKSGPAKSFIATLREAGVEVVDVSSDEVAQAVGQFIDAATNDGLRHLNGSALNSALNNAVPRLSGDAWVWNRRPATKPGETKPDISALCAVTVAVGGVPSVMVPEIHVWSGGAT